MKYDKLVRDRAPEIIRKDGKTPIVDTADGKGLYKYLKENLLEEVREFFDNSSKEELADVAEVINAICASYDFSREEVEAIIEEKREKRGGFEKRVILKEIK